VLDSSRHHLRLLLLHALRVSARPEPTRAVRPWEPPSGAVTDNRGWATSGCPGLGRAALWARASPLGLPRPSAAIGIAPSRVNAATTAIAGQSRAPWPSGRGSPRAKTRSPVNAQGTTNARATLLPDPPPPVVACCRWPPPQSPATMAKRPRATSAHTASARGRVLQPRSRPALQSPSPAAASRGRPFLGSPLFLGVQRKETVFPSLCLAVCA
jgi:hypothetical protein